MDVRFCEGRNHRREARVRAAGSARVRRARSSEARLRRIFFSLTKTYMDVVKPETEPKRLLFRTTAPEGRVLASRIFLFSRGPMRGPQVPKQGWISLF